MPDVLGLLVGILGMALIALLVVGLMAAGMLAWGFQRTMAKTEEKEDPPEVAELRRRLDGGEISLVEFNERMRALRRRK
ncbi:MAG TPA: hypothetical protein VIR16_03630 [Candidatus Limnocylindrales bacterium]